MVFEDMLAKLRALQTDSPVPCSVCNQTEVLLASDPLRSPATLLLKHRSPCVVNLAGLLGKFMTEDFEMTEADVPPQLMKHWVH